MNERIVELKNQTLDKHFSYTWSKMDYDDVTKFAEKFAELIVQRCITAVENTGYGYRDYRAQIEEGMRNACVESIKHEFGVEL